VTAAAGLDVTLRSFSAAFGDPDRDGDLDLVLTHWGTVQPVPRTELFWRNVGGGTFVEASAEVGLTAWPSPRLGIDLDLTFTPNFADLNGDGWPDLLMASDYATSRVFLNDGAGGFRDVTTPVISDENGMGAPWATTTTTASSIGSSRPSGIPTDRRARIGTPAAIGSTAAVATARSTTSPTPPACARASGAGAARSPTSTTTATSTSST
jgi:hypothetical protein